MPRGRGGARQDLRRARPARGVAATTVPGEAPRSEWRGGRRGGRTWGPDRGGRGRTRHRGSRSEAAEVASQQMIADAWASAGAGVLLLQNLSALLATSIRAVGPDAGRCPMPWLRPTPPLRPRSRGRSPDQLPRRLSVRPPAASIGYGVVAWGERAGSGGGDAGGTENVGSGGGTERRGGGEGGTPGGSRWERWVVGNDEDVRRRYRFDGGGMRGKTASLAGRPTAIPSTGGVAAGQRGVTSGRTRQRRVA